MTFRWNPQENTKQNKLKVLTRVMVDDFKDGHERSLRTDVEATTIQSPHPVVLHARITGRLVTISDGQYIGRFIWKQKFLSAHCSSKDTRELCVSAA